MATKRIVLLLFTSDNGSKSRDNRHQFRHQITDRHRTRWIIGIAFDKKTEFAKCVSRVRIASRCITQSEESVVDEQRHESSPASVISKLDRLIMKIWFCLYKCNNIPKQKED